MAATSEDTRPSSTTPEAVEDARAEAERRFPDGIDVETGEPVDDYGYPATAREAFIGGAVWAASRAVPSDHMATTEDALCAALIAEYGGNEDDWRAMESLRRVISAAGLLATAHWTEAP